MRIRVVRQHGLFVQKLRQDADPVCGKSQLPTKAKQDTDSLEAPAARFSNLLSSLSSRCGLLHTLVVFLCVYFGFFLVDIIQNANPSPKVIHVGLKPSNVLAYYGSFFISDFGLPRVPDQVDPDFHEIVKTLSN